MFSAVSECGPRSQNQDYYGWCKAGKYFCLYVADGMGGHAFGKEAAHAACSALESTLPPLLSRIDIRNKKDRARLVRKLFLDVVRKDVMESGGHTTLTLAIVGSKYCRFFWVGDSPACILRRITSGAGLMLDKTKDMLKPHGVGSMVFRGLGEYFDLADSTPSYARRVLGKHDMLVLCTDGADPFFEDPDQDRLQSTLNIMGWRGGTNRPAHIVAKSAYELGSTDNCTVIVAKRI